MVKSIQKAFTLIELLIVVAIIAILAAIAVPNFLEAQVRAKVSRVKTDMRSMATAIEAYDVEHTALPPFFEMYRLSTPVAYITSGLLPDPFGTEDAFLVGDQAIYFYSPLDRRSGDIADFFDVIMPGIGMTPEEEANILRHRWILDSNGPDRQLELLKYPPPFLIQLAEFILGATQNSDEIYDPTNGTVSGGDIWFSAKGFREGAND